MSGSLESVVRNITTLHGAFFNSSLPEFLQDIYINSLSHIRTAAWFADGRCALWGHVGWGGVGSARSPCGLGEELGFQGSTGTKWGCMRAEGPSD